MWGFLCVSMQLRVPWVCINTQVRVHRLRTCTLAARAMRDGHHRGSAASERGGSVKDLKPRSPAERETDRLWCWCEQIKGSQNEWNGPLSAVERALRWNRACLLCLLPPIKEGGLGWGGGWLAERLRKMRGKCVWERDTHKKTGRERECGGGVQNPIDFTRVLNPNTAVFYICVQPRTKDIYICNIHLNTARGQVRKISGARCKYFIYIYIHTHTHTHTHTYTVYTRLTIYGVDYLEQNAKHFLCRQNKQKASLSCCAGTNNTTWLVMSRTANVNSQRKDTRPRAKHRNRQSPQLKSALVLFWSWQRWNRNTDTYIKWWLNRGRPG